MLECLVDGEISDQVPVADRGFQYGDGLFETLAVIAGKPRFWQRHMDRLQEGCDRLDLPATPQGILLREVQTVAAGQGDCVVKIMMTRGVSGRGYAAGRPQVANRVVCSYPWPSGSEGLAKLGIRARVCDLRLGIQPALAGVKHLNRLEQILARKEWDDDGIHEGILLNTEEYVISAISSNIFLVKNGQLLTPRLDRCGVRGVMRQAIMRKFAAKCEQRRITLDMLPEADEVFVCNTIRGVLPVRRVDDWEYDIGPVTREVQAWLEER